MADFDIAIIPVLKHEGGYANVKGDAGGETYGGITRKNWPHWSGWQFVDAAKPLRRNQRAPAADLLLEHFYREQYWQKIKGDLITDQRTAGFLLDFYVNSGYHAVKCVQKIVGSAQDGVVGPQTLAAINNTAGLFEELKQARIAFVQQVAKRGDNEKFLAGWLRRINSFK